MIAYLAAEAIRLERALTNPIETELEDLSLDLDNITPATEGPATDATEGTRAPKRKPAKQPAKRKSASKTTTEGSTATPIASIMTNIADPRPSNTTDNSTTTNTDTTSMSMETVSGK